MARFRDGKTWYFGILPDFAVDDKSAKNVRLRFPEKAYIYNVRSGEYFGYTNFVMTNIEPGCAQLYACLPYRVEGLSIDVPSSVVRGKLISIGIKMIAEQSGPHAVRVELEYPNGIKPEYLQRVIYLPKGKGKFSFVPALNAPNGKWKINVVDCVSMIGTKAEFYVK